MAVSNPAVRHSKLCDLGGVTMGVLRCKCRSSHGFDRQVWYMKKPKQYIYCFGLVIVFRTI